MKQIQLYDRGGGGQDKSNEATKNGICLGVSRFSSHTSCMNNSALVAEFQLCSVLINFAHSFNVDRDFTRSLANV